MSNLELTLSDLSDMYADVHNKTLVWFDMIHKADSPEAVRMCWERWDSYNNRSAGIRSLMIELVMKENGFLLSSDGKYFEM